VKTLSPWKNVRCTNAEKREGVKKRTSVCGNTLMKGNNANISSEIRDSRIMFMKRIMRKEGNERKTLR
jgi:hypothetical protein